MSPPSGSFLPAECERRLTASAFHAPEVVTCSGCAPCYHVAALIHSTAPHPGHPDSLVSFPHRYCRSCSSKSGYRVSFRSLVHPNVRGWDDRGLQDSDAVYPAGTGCQERVDSRPAGGSPVSALHGGTQMVSPRMGKPTVRCHSKNQAQSHTRRDSRQRRC